jgi:hypothetical protein
MAGPKLGDPVFCEADLRCVDGAHISLAEVWGCLLLDTAVLSML